MARELCRDEAAVFAIYGEGVKDDVMDRLRRTTNLPMPNRGPLSLAGVPEAFEATQIPNRKNEQVSLTQQNS